eukprot:EC719479.1.p1 GENE.EC719479.1~~EC719479.1.p1  ORF type:complete len:104 (+),score=18.92 EC719479.1:26-337(+)
MKVTFVALILAAAIVGTFASTLLQQQRTQFEAFKRKHEKTYSGVEHEKRFAIFQDNLKRIDAMNKLDTGAVYAVNKFCRLDRRGVRQHVPEQAHSQCCSPPRR